jgi:Acyl-CoA carboxylase epsilon subunit
VSESSDPTAEPAETAGTADAEPAAPALRIVSGTPSPEELAALAAVIAAASGGEDQPRARVRRGGWNDPAAQHRPQLIPGPNAWRSSLR